MTDFQKGVSSMARSCQSALWLVRSGEWTLDTFEDWLKAVLKEDAGALQRFEKMIVDKNKSEN